MRKFNVKSLFLGGRGNRIFKSGDIVYEHNFPEGHADSLVNSGHLTAIEEEDPGEGTPVQDENLKKNPGPDPGEGTPVQDESVKTPEVPRGTSEGESESSDGDASDRTADGAASGIDSISKNNIMKDLKDRDVKFNPASPKSELYKLWLAS